MTMAFRYEEPCTSEMGKKVLKTMTGFDFELDKVRMKDLVLSEYQSFERLKEKAKFDQDWKAQSKLAMAYRYGVPELNVKQDVDTAIGWYESSIHNGNCCATDILNLATLHDVKGTTIHQRRAYELYLQAAALGSVRAEFNLAEMYRCGVDGVVSEDLEESFKWYRRAAGEEPFDDEEVSPLCSTSVKSTMRNLDIDSKVKALKQLHTYYMNGDCPERIPQKFKAVYYLKKAALLGDPEAQKELGLFYLKGLDVSGHTKDVDKAKRWLEKAAKSGDQEAKEALKKLKEKDIIDVVESTKDKLSPISAFQQYCDILKMDIEQQHHPLVIKNPTLFQESTFTQFPDSPTAQRYLKAFRLVKKGLDKLLCSRFTDPEAIKLIALGVLYENSITQAFLETTESINFLTFLFSFISRIQKNNPSFFEGLLLIIIFHPLQPKISLESEKLDLKKIMCLNNLIHLIKKAEPDKPPKENPYNFEEDYSSWLQELYYHLGSLYIVSGCFKNGAEAFQEALNCCPSYYEAKTPLAYCFMSMATAMKNKESKNSCEELLETFEPPLNQRTPKGDYSTWTEDKLRRKAKQLFMEYLQEAPECDKKYPHGHYHLALLYMLENNIEEAVMWKEKGEDSEEKRLPFLGPVEAGSKKLLSMLDLLPVRRITNKKCSNKTCSKKNGGQLKLKPCPCHRVAYCGRECQAADWKAGHNKTCSTKKKEKERKKK